MFVVYISFFLINFKIIYFNLMLHIQYSLCTLFFMVLKRWLTYVYTQLVINLSIPNIKIFSAYFSQIPLTMLMKRDIFPKMNDHSISPKENELRALSTFFKQSCIVGKWSPDPKTLTFWSKLFKLSLAIYSTYQETQLS